MSSDLSNRWYRRLWRHPVFPVLVFVVASKALGEFYPFSPFSMYSNPTTKPLIYCYVADGEGEALPILNHTGVSPASITKNYNRLRHEFAEDNEGSPDDLDFRSLAGVEVLRDLRERSRKRKGRELTDAIQLIEVSIGFDETGAGLRETPVGVGILEAETKTP